MTAQDCESLKEKFARLAEKKFDDLAYKAGVDISTNRALAAEVKALETSAESLSDKASSVGCAMLHFFIVSLVPLGALLVLEEPSRGVVKILIGVSVLFALIGVLALLVQKALHKRIAALNSKISEKKDAAEKLMEPLNRIYGWDIPCRLIEEVCPQIKFDRFLTAASLDALRGRYGWDDKFNDGISVRFALSGTAEGTPFVFCRYVEREWGEETYTGRKEITWKEWEYDEDSDGKRTRKRVTQHQTLIGKMKKPCPFFPERRFLVVASEATPELPFTHDASAIGFDEEPVVSRFKKAWGDVELRYGDDFAFLRRAKVNVLVSKRLSAADVDTDPSQFARWSFDEAREFFLDFNNRYFEDVCLSLATVLALPGIAGASGAVSTQGGAASGDDPSEWELEATANRLGHPRFMPPECKTRCILKAGSVSKDQDGVMEVEITAYGYRALEMVEEVTCGGGDGKNHIVRVPWPEYHEAEGAKRMLAYAGDEPTATFKRRMAESSVNGPFRTIYAYVP